jgi:hypothetical protein
MTEINKKTTFGWQAVVIIASIAFTAGALFLKVDYLAEDVTQLTLAVDDIKRIVNNHDKFASK